MSTVYDRDLIGYGPTPPDPKWPNGARLALNFVINVEEGSEPSVQDGEGYTEVQHTEAFGRQQGLDGRDLAGVPAHERGVGLMFQDYALFPHMSVLENVKYGLTFSGFGKDIEYELAHADENQLIAAVDSRYRPSTSPYGREPKRDFASRLILSKSMGAGGAMAPEASLREKNSTVKSSMAVADCSTFMGSSAPSGVTVTKARQSHGSKVQAGLLASS